LVYALIRGTSTAPTTQGRVQYADGEWDPDKHSGSPDNVSRPVTTPYRVLTARPKTGQIFFDVTNTLSAPSARVVYRNQDGWLEQPSVAARSYVPFMDRTGVTFSGNEERGWPREPWREYFYDAAGASGVTGPSPRKAIVLHASEAGNTYLATYRLSGTQELRDVPVTAESEVVEVSQLGFGLGAFTGSYANSTAAAAGTTHVALLYLPDVNGYKIGLPVNEGGSGVPQHVTSILSLRGSSVRVRSAWFDGSRYSQAAVTGYRSLDVESANRP
jgi:hypothetical protein